MQKNKKVGIILGGLSSEREVSLKTGAAFEKAVKNLGYEYALIDAGKNFPQDIQNAKIDCALIALHGKYGEDGTVQGILEYLKIPYTGSGVMASALAMNKVATKQILTHWGVPTADFRLLSVLSMSEKEIHSQSQKFLQDLGLPLVVKPMQEGSAVGVTIAHTESEVLEGVKLAAQFDRQILFEKYIPGIEITVPIWFDQVLPIIEIRPRGDFYDYKRKYTAGQTEYIIPAPLTFEVQKKCERFAMETFKAVGCRHYARVDLRITPEGNPFVLEINTLPGCTETSLFPKSASKVGLSFENIIERLIQSATLDYK